MQGNEYGENMGTNDQISCHLDWFANCSCQLPFVKQVPNAYV